MPSFFDAFPIFDAAGDCDLRFCKEPRQRWLIHQSSLRDRLRAVPNDRAERPGGRSRSPQLPLSNIRLPRRSDWTILAIMFEARCVDCQAPVGFAERPGRATCPDCGLRLYLTADGQLGRMPADDWQPGGIQGRRD
jgi:DNA-directed RNA polymerase subunit RPC12/RpoP